MSLQKVKNWARVLSRANVPAFIVGVHGIGKTSAIYQLYQEGAAERGQQALGKKDIEKALMTSGSNSGEVIDIKSLSSLDGKLLARAHESLDQYGFWSMSAPNISIEELIGMPHVDDRGAVYRDAYFRAQDAAATLVARRTVTDTVDKDVDVLEKLTDAIFDRNCTRLGISERDRNDIVLRYLRMHALMPDPRHIGGGIWNIDELNRGFQEVEKAFMQLLLERRYLDYVVPDGVWICTSMNPPGGNYQVREMDMATLDRGALMTVRSSKEEWLEWAAKRGLSETSRVFVDKHDKLLNKSESEVDIDSIVTEGTYRSVEWCDKAFACMVGDEMNTTGLMIANSLLGREAGTAYYKEATETMHRALTAEEVVKGYGWKKEMTTEEEKDFKSWKVTKTRSRLRSMINQLNVKTELVRFTLGEIKEWIEVLDEDLKKRGSTKSNPKHSKEERGAILNIMLFLHDLPVDLSRAFIMDSVDDRFYRIMYWTGRYPVCITLHNKIETEFKEAVNG